jgi:hypothetical protein
MRAWLWVGVLIVLAAVIGVACGGGGGDGDAEPTPDRPTLEAMLTEISLKVEDLPPGFGEPTEGFVENEEFVENDPEGPTKALERVEGWGRLLGHDASFFVTDPVGTFTKGGTALIISNVSIFADEQGAIEALEWGRDVLSDPADSAARLIPNASDLEGGLISFPTIGDETVAAEFTGNTQPEGVPIKVDFTADVVAIRNGKGVAYIAVGAIGGAKPGPEVDEIIGILNDRLETVLR